MNKLYSALAVFGVVLSAHAATPVKPKVVFIGDYVTANWTSGFAANPNWVNQGQDGISFGGGQTGPPDIDTAIALHPTIIHILMGASISATSDVNTLANALPYFAQQLGIMAKKAQAANVKVILGLTPSANAGWGDYDTGFFNSIVAAYGATHNIEVVNYADAMCQCVGALGQNTETPNAFQQMTVIPNGPAAPTWPATAGLLPTASGYALMTQMAQTAIANEYLTLETGWLSNVVAPDYAVDYSGGSQVSTCGQTCVIQFTPTGYYSDGSIHPQTNTTWNATNGIWTSSNPLVVAVSQQGVAYALTIGTATIKYTPARGVKFSSWVMTIKNDGFGN